eukprot:6804449-Pyramimonas_sp.AAC.1
MVRVMTKLRNAINGLRLTLVTSRGAFYQLCHIRTAAEGEFRRLAAGGLRAVALGESVQFWGGALEQQQVQEAAHGDEAGGELAAEHRLAQQQQ